MIKESTISKLTEMHLSTMAENYRLQFSSNDFNELTFDERFGMLVDEEYATRKSNRLHRLIKNADMEQSDACIAGIDFQSGRKLNKNLILRLATCEYITDYKNIFITGASGSGKTYMACAFGIEACKKFYTVKFVRLPDLLLDLKAAKRNNNFRTVLKRYTNPTVLILDEWLLMKLSREAPKICWNSFITDVKNLQPFSVHNSEMMNGMKEFRTVVKTQ